MFKGLMEGAYAFNNRWNAFNNRWKTTNTIKREGFYKR